MIVMQIQCKHNREKPVVFNTIQCYLKDARPRLHVELETHRRLGVRSAFKLVRGAYILQERERAEGMGYPDPICDDIAMTHANYDMCVSDAIRRVSTEGAAVMVASHNQKSIESAVNEMAQSGIGPDDGVYFGQLLGMGDHLTTAIADHGCRPYKYVPYGPIDKCVAYLTRRVKENSTMLAGEPILKERKMLASELLKRITLQS
jgi:proline dehydrogenase